MEKDKRIERLIKESGLVSAPKNFTANVMDRIYAEPVKKIYKPLLGRFGKLSILAIALTAIVISIIYSEPSGYLAERNVDLPSWKLNPSEWNLNLPQLELNLPQWEQSLQKFSEMNFSTGLVAALLAVFILVLTDNVLRKRRFV